MSASFADISLDVPKYGCMLLRGCRMSDNERVLDMLQSIEKDAAAHISIWGDAMHAPTSDCEQRAQCVVKNFSSGASWRGDAFDLHRDGEPLLKNSEFIAISALLEAQHALYDKNDKGQIIVPNKEIAALNTFVGVQTIKQTSDGTVLHKGGKSKKKVNNSMLGTPTAKKKAMTTLAGIVKDGRRRACIETCSAYRALPQHYRDACLAVRSASEERGNVMQQLQGVGQDVLGCLRCDDDAVLPMQVSVSSMLQPVVVRKETRISPDQAIMNVDGVKDRLGHVRMHAKTVTLPCYRTSDKEHQGRGA